MIASAAFARSARVGRLARWLTMIAALAGLLTLAAVSAEATPLSPAKATLIELGTAPPIELARQGCGWGGIAFTGGTVGATGIGVAASRTGDGPAPLLCTGRGP